MKEAENLRGSRWVVGANIVLNLFILGLFKYYNFFLSSFVDAFGVDADSILLNVVLPVGISFYTFQALSYSIDVYRGAIKPTRDIVQLFAYISFFPQLVAGPIERATNLLPQFATVRKFEYKEAVDGCRQILWGFFKKILIADICALGVNNIFESYEMASGLVLILGALLFTFQIYGDFSGYSDIAIGCSKLLGIRLMRNFDTPYFSRDIAEFWRRWHISLTTWFRDYLYIPLGGSRVGKSKLIRNTFIIFLVSGFWHGANWTFIAWGAYHALLFVPLLLSNRNRVYRDVVACERALPTFKEVGQILLTLAFVAVGWVIFRADSIGDAWGYLSGMVTHPFTLELEDITNYLPSSNMRFLAYALPILLVVEWLGRRRNHSFEFNLQNPLLRIKAVRWVIYLAFIIYILYASNSNASADAQQFIYFQF